MQRRQFIIGASATALSSAIIACHFVSDDNKGNSLVVSAASDKQGKHFVVASTLDGNLVSQTPLPQRGHDSIVLGHKKHHVLVLARRPDRFAIEINALTGQVTHRFESQEGFHFYGHGQFSKDGKLLYTSENDYLNYRGVIVVRDTENYSVVEQLDSGGIGPHQIKLMPSGQALAIANGGIKTHPDWPRMKLNIDTMQSNLSILDLTTGKITQQYHAPLTKQSIRHLDVDKNGDIYLGMQYQGAKSKVVPLVYKQTLNADLQAMHASNEQWLSMRQYTASVALAKNRLLITCPRGKTITIWDTKTLNLVDTITVKDAAGAAQINDAFYVSSGHGILYKEQHRKLEEQAVLAHLKFDNHMSIVPV